MGVMGNRSRGYKALTIVWALLIGIGLIALAGSVLLPSTKRARIDWDEVRRLEAKRQADSDAVQAATLITPATQPGSTTQPAAP